jgi:hemerythrin superfamily protein
MGYISHDTHTYTMVPTRRTSLNRIMQIEQEIKNIKTNTQYQQILNNIKIMDTLSRGSRNIDVASPDDMDKTITVRRRSQEARDIAETYTQNLQKYSNRLQKLRDEKAVLQKQLFK